MNILFISDIVGNSGKRVLSDTLEQIKEDYSIDLCVANGENIAGGKGITRNLSTKLKRYGVDIITSGNHIWANPDIISDLDTDPTILRPLNYPDGNHGNGSTIIALDSGIEVGVINLQGRVFMPDIECPFKKGLKEVEKLKQRTSIILVDFHAEATSEKEALGWYLDGKVSAVVGTHTHVQTADERILPKGTAYITDVGMTGSRDSVLGVKKELAIRKFLLQSYVRFEPASENPMLNAVVIDVDETTGKAIKIERILKEVKTE